MLAFYGVLASLVGSILGIGLGAILTRRASSFSE